MLSVGESETFINRNKSCGRFHTELSLAWTAHARLQVSCEVSTFLHNLKLH